MEISYLLRAAVSNPHSSIDSFQDAIYNSCYWSRPWLDKIETVQKRFLFGNLKLFDEME